MKSEDEWKNKPKVRKKLNFLTHCDSDKISV